MNRNFIFFFLSIFFLVDIYSQESIEKPITFDFEHHRLNFEVDIGVPHIVGFGFEFFLTKIKPKYSLFYSKGGKKIFDEPFKQIAKNYDFFDFSVNKVEYGLNIYFNKNIYVSIGNYEMDLNLEYDNQDNARLISDLRNSSPVFKVGYKYEKKIYLKTELGYNFNFPENIFGSGRVSDIDVITTINSNKIPLVDNNGFFLASVKIGYGFL